MQYPISVPEVNLYSGKFTNGNPVGGIPRSIDRAEDQNRVYDELIALVVGAGLTASEADNTQVLQAVKALIASNGNDYIARFTTTGNINLTGLGTQAGGDWAGALTAGDIILAKDQTTGSQNGWYVAAAGAWARVTWADTSAEIKPGALTQVSEGATLADSIWMLTTDAPVTLGITALAFARKDSSDLNSIQNFRLTLTNGLPVTTADVISAGTLYFTPYLGNAITLYSGAAWFRFNMAQKSIAMPAAINTNYDVFVDYNSGVPILALLAWTNDTTRATALAYQDGIYVLSGTPTKRYVGTIRTTGVANQCEDSKAKRFVWNYNNRVNRAMARSDATATWTYTTNAFRQANGTVANQLDFVVGISEDAIIANAFGQSVNGTLAVQNTTGIGLDSTTVNSGSSAMFTNPSGGSSGASNSIFNATIAEGRHFLAWLEYSGATGTTTWNGTSAPVKTGIFGNILG